MYEEGMRSCNYIREKENNSAMSPKQAYSYTEDNKLFLVTGKLIYSHVTTTISYALAFFNYCCGDNY